MAGKPSDIDSADEPLPVDGTPGPTGIRLTLELSGLFGVALVILGLVAIGTLLTDAIAIVLTIVGVFLVIRWVQRISWERNSRARLQRRATGMSEDLAVSDDVHEDISAHDLRPDNPARREVEHRTN